MQELRIAISFVFYQLKLRWKFMLFYFLAFMGISFLFALVYPTLREDADQIQAAIEAFDPAMLAAFNINAETYLSNVESYIGGELLIFLVLVNSIAFALIAAGAVAGNYKNKIIFNYLHKPMSRTTVALTQIVAEALTILIVNLTVIIGVWAVFRVIVPDEPLQFDYLNTLFLGLVLLSLAYSAIGKVLSIFFSFTVSSVIAVTWAFADFIFAGLGQMNGAPEIISQVSLVHWLNVQEITETSSISSEAVGVLLAVAVVGYLAFIVLFNRKDFFVQ